MQHLYATAQNWDVLKRTLPKIYSGNFKERADWMERFYRSHAYMDLQHNNEVIIDRYGITDRDRDSCGEMNDCPEVIAEMLRRIDSDRELAIAVTGAEGPCVIQHWRELAKHTRQKILF